jgi:ParB-like chromosome segregation protein Spo0J
MAGILLRLKGRRLKSLDKLIAPSTTLKWVDRELIKPNDYNPNKVSKQNLELLTQSIFTNGWTLPIVVRPDYTIIDGFHRWTVAGPDWKYVPQSEKDDKRTLYERLGGKVLIVVVDHKDKAGNIYGTVTHNRARGTHLLEPMKAIVKELMNEGKTVDEISRQLGMKPEEIFRLSDFSKEDFLKMMALGHEKYSKAEYITKI